MRSSLCALVATTTVLFSRDVAAAADDSKSPACFLRRTSFGTESHTFLGRNNYRYKPAKKPFPSLTQCYKNNQLSCCVSAHDAYIEAKYAAILSSTCLREYQHLENYFCLGCYPYQGQYLVTDNSTDADSPYILDDSGDGVFTLRICKSFAQKLYDPKEDGSYNYNGCGLLDADTGEGYLPQEKYANYSEFIQAIKPPYFEKVKWLVINDDVKPHPKCFSAGTTMQMGMVTFVIAALAHLFS